MSATSFGGHAQARKGRTLLAIAMAVFATIEVIYEWVSVWRELRGRVGRWWDDVEHREHEAAVRAGMRWMAGRFDRQETAPHPDGGPTTVDRGTPAAALHG